MWAFCPQKEGIHTGDNHKVFHGKNFVTWFCDALLLNLTQKLLIMLVNAKYHLVDGNDVPKLSKMKKEECLVIILYLFNFKCQSCWTQEQVQLQLLLHRCIVVQWILAGDSLNLGGKTTHQLPKTLQTKFNTKYLE